MVKSKEITGTLKLQIPAGQASAAPPVGTALGPKKVNIGEFVKQFNDRTKGMKGPIPVKMVIYKDNSFDFELRKPPTSYLILQAAGLKKGSQVPGRDVVGEITIDQAKSIAEEKMEEMGVLNIEAAIRTVKGVALSMGIKVE